MTLDALLWTSLVLVFVLPGASFAYGWLVTMPEKRWMTIGELCEAEGTDPPKWADLTGRCVYVCPEHRRTCFVSIDMPEDEHEHVCPLDVARSPS